jgi:Fe-Mn family superoxide dismutase
MAHQLPELRFSSDALAPHISAETLSFHHGKHHAGYVKKLNAALEGTGLENKPLAELIADINSVPADKRTGIFNNAAQHFNHSFYWESLSPGSNGPDDSTSRILSASFGSVEAFTDEFSAKAKTLFGSGWAWLVQDGDGALSVVQTKDAGCPLTDGLRPILTCDVWEHAYYIDYRNARPDYVSAFWKICNWDFVAENLG